MKNPCLAAVLEELNASDVRHITRSQGGKHVQLRWPTPRGERMITLPMTPSDHRASDNARAVVRRMLREDGMLVEAEQRKPPPLRQHDRLTLMERRLATLEQRIAILETPKNRTP
jgi:hypothetical protein